MPTEKTTVRIDAAALEFLMAWAPLEGPAAGGAIRWASEWAAAVLRQGMRRGLSGLSVDERRAILAAVNGWAWNGSVTGEILAREIEDFFAMGEGRAWGWRAESIDALVQRLAAWGCERAQGVVLWAAAFWREPEAGIDAYLAG